MTFLSLSSLSFFACDARSGNRCFEWRGQKKRCRDGDGNQGSKKWREREVDKIQRKKHHISRERDANEIAPNEIMIWYRSEGEGRHLVLNEGSFCGECVCTRSDYGLHSPATRIIFLHGQRARSIVKPSFPIHFHVNSFPGSKVTFYCTSNAVLTPIPFLGIWWTFKPGLWIH